jgi:PAS domain S-box-containing protein
MRRIAWDDLASLEPRLLRQIVHDAAEIAGAPLVELVAREGRSWRTLAQAGKGLRARATLVPGPAGAPPPPGRRRIGPCPAPLAASLGRRPSSAGPGAGSNPPRLQIVELPLVARGEAIGSLRFVVAGKPSPATLRVHLETERLRRELTGERAAYRAFQEHAGDSILVVDPQTGRVLEGNHRLAEATGFTDRELSRLTLGRLIAHPLLDEEALLVWLREERVVHSEETVLRRRRGAPVPASITSTRIDLPRRSVLHILARDASRERNALAVAKAAKDTVTALNLAGANLMVETDRGAIYGVISRELLRLGFHSAVLLAERTPEGPRPPFRYAFTSFNAPLQRAAERLLGIALYDLRIDPAHAPLVRRLLTEGRTVYTDKGTQAARDLFGGQENVRLARLLGLKRVILAPLRFTQGIGGILAVSSERMRPTDPEAIDAFALQASIALEKARLFGELKEQQGRLEAEVDRRTRELSLAVRALKELDRRKDNFLANVSHELRTPLVTVLGYTELLLSGKLGELPDKQRDCLKVSHASGKRLKGFIDELLDFSRHELTKEGLALGAVEIGDVLNQAVIAMAPRMAERGISLRARVARRPPPVWADRERLLQVLTNLIGNAERYCADGGRIGIVASRRRPGRIEVTVSDNGSGIAAAHLPRIFDRLYQVGDVARTREQGAGLGLGLNIVKSIVEAHGGTIAVRSRVGRGTTFRFSLPTVDSVLREEEGSPARSEIHP